MANTLSGKKILLTGGQGTLGKAQTKKLSEQGAHVVVLDLPESKDAEDSVAAKAENTRFFGCDLNDLSGVQTHVGRLVEEIGGFDILINNAALIINKPFDEFTSKEYEEQIRVNSTAAFVLSKICAQHMKKCNYGKIVNFTSITLTGHWNGYVPYVASKGALFGLTKSLARELGPYGINVNAISPGAVVSEAEARVFGDRLQEYNDWVIERQCLKKRIHPDDIANLVYFLISPASDMITGQNYFIDGGW